jgi:cytosine/uracil/thiamine/allantoin permease
LAGPTITRLTSETAEKMKDIYQNHREIVISVTVATAVYLIMRKKEQKKEEPEHTLTKKQFKKSILKSFISEHSESEE